MRIPKGAVDDYIGWCKILLGINSAAIGALLFKGGSGSTIDTSIAIATFSFFGSLVIFYADLIEIKHTGSDFRSLLLGHDNSTHGESYRSGILVTLGWSLFLIGFFALAWRIVYGG